MKIVLDNIIYSKVNQGGVSNYWFELSKYLMNQSNETISFYEEQNALENFHRQHLFIPNNQFISDQNKRHSLLSRILPIHYQSQESFIYHSSYYRALKGAPNQQEVTTIHDFTHNYYSPTPKRIIHNRLKFEAIKRSKGVICISNNTFSDLKKFCPLLRNQKVEVIHNGVSNDFFPIQNFTEQDLIFYKTHRLDSDYIVYIGSRTNYKNFLFVVALAKELNNCKLLIVGSPLTVSEKKFFTTELYDRTIVLTNVSNAELNLIYNNAVALVYPSSYEGFGIPIIEAMKASCPVIALDNSSITEVAGKAGLLLKGLEIKKFLEKIDLIQCNSQFKEELLQRGIENSKDFSWDKCCLETHNFYKEIAAQF